MNESNNTILLTGVPRAGTTLCCKLLNEYVNTVALFEPLDVLEMRSINSAAEAIDYVDRFVADTRGQLKAGRPVYTKHRAGVIPDNPITLMRSESGLRQMDVDRGPIHITKRLSEGFHLIIKHNALFTALLPELAARFPCYAVVRNPLSVLASWNSVDLPVNKGRVPMGEHYDAKLSRRLDKESNPLARQLILLDWFFSQFSAYLPSTQIIYYEKVIESRGAQLAALAHPGAAPVDLQLEDNNKKKLYVNEGLQAYAEALLQSEGAYWQYYDRKQVAETLRAILG